MEVVINYWAIIAAAVASMVVGMLWYGPIFGKQWMAIMGITKEGMKSMTMTPIGAMIGGFIASSAMGYVLSHSLVFANAYLGTSGIAGGLMAGFWSWFGFVAPVTIGVVLWDGKPWKLWFINGSYYLVTLLIMGGILAMW